MLGISASAARPDKCPLNVAQAVPLSGGHVVYSPANLVDCPSESPGAGAAVLVDIMLVKPNTNGLPREAVHHRDDSRLLPSPQVRPNLLVTAVLHGLTVSPVGHHTDKDRSASKVLAADLDLLVRHGQVADHDDPGTVAAVDGTSSAGLSRSPGVEQALSPDQQSVVLRAMQDRLSELVRVDDLAALVGYSRYHFQRRFQATFGITPYQFLVDLRVRTAREILESEKTRSMRLVAKQCGFTRTESFIRAFRQRVGTTPGRYAADHRPGRQ